MYKCLNMCTCISKEVSWLNIMQHVERLVKYELGERET